MKLLASLMDEHSKKLKFAHVSVQFETERSISDSPAVKAEYLSCLKHLLSLISDTDRTRSCEEATLKELEDEIKRLESELHHRKRKN